MKRGLFLFFLCLMLACQRKETELLVPVEAPRPPEIGGIIKQELNCSMPFNVRFYAQVANEIGDEAYEWTIGGNTYSSSSPTVQVSQIGDLEVKLKVSNQVGSDTYIITFNYPTNTLPVIPIFNYGAENNNYRVPANLTFTDLSQRATGVSWDFGDGYQSNLKNPEHIYTQSGTYTVTLTAWCDSDTAKKTAQVIISPRPDVVRFTRFDVLSFPEDYFPENQEDDTYGGDFYVELYRDNFKYGTGDVMRNKSKLPLYWRCPEDWNGEHRLFYGANSSYKATLVDENDATDTEILNAIFDGNYLKNNYYPKQLDFHSGELHFRIYLDYED